MKTDDVRHLKPLDRLVYFTKEREAIRLKKEAGEPRPWTDDEILQSYRFCNVRRMDDKVSRWLLDNWYEPHRDHPNILAAVALARFFNLPHSLQPITKWVFQDKHEPLWGEIKVNLRSRKKFGSVFNGAYIVPSHKESQDKIGAVVDYFVRPLVETAAVAKADKAPFIRTDSMRQTHESLVTCHGFGSFMAGQVVADLRHAMTGDWSDRNEWAPVGPGSARGMARLLYAVDEWENVARDFTSSSVSKDGPRAWLEDLTHTVIPYVRSKLPSKIKDRLEAHDYQNCLCEIDKYTRVLEGSGKPKQKYPGAG